MLLLFSSSFPGDILCTLTMNGNLVPYVLITGLFSIILFLYGFFPMKKYDGTIAAEGSIPETVANIR